MRAPLAEAGYCAPEQEHESGDQRSDIFTLAVMLFELVSGQRPSTKMPPRLRSLVSVPAEVDFLLMKALAEDPEQRYTDLGVMRAALRDVLGLGAPPDRPGKPASAAAKPPAAASSPAGQDGEAKFAAAKGSPTPTVDGPPSSPRKSWGLAAREHSEPAPPQRLMPVPPDSANARPTEVQHLSLVADATWVLPAAVAPGRVADPPTEPLMHRPPVRTDVQKGQSVVLMDELPTVVQSSRNRPRHARAMAPKGATKPEREHETEKTEAAQRSVIMAPVMDRTEILGHSVLRDFGQGSEGPRQHRHEPDSPTLMLADGSASPPPLKSQVPSEPTGVDVESPSAQPVSWTLQMKLVVVNLVFLALIVLGLLVWALLTV